MSDDDLKTLFRHNSANCLAPEFPTVLTHQPRRYRPRPASMLVTVLVVAAIALPFLLPAKRVERLPTPVALAVDVPTTDWLLSVPEIDRSHAVSQ